MSLLPRKRPDRYVAPSDATGHKRPKCGAANRPQFAPQVGERENFVGKPIRTIPEGLGGILGPEASSYLTLALPFRDLGAE
jgi:hypothetical protein